MSASPEIVRATAIAWRWPPDRRATGTSMRGMLIPIWSSAARASRFIMRVVQRTGTGLRTSSRLEEQVLVDGQLVDQGQVLEAPCRRRERGASSTDLGRVGLALAPHRSRCRAAGTRHRILIRVDLPAPLSPSRPRTSPLRRCMLMSRSATVGPNDLPTCSTRRTSSSAVVGADDRAAGDSRCSATAAAPSSHAST